MFSLPCRLTGLPEGTDDFWIILSSVFPVELLKYSSTALAFGPFPGVNGLPIGTRPVFVGLLKLAGVSFIAVSKAVGSSLAPGGLRFLLGLPWGVETGFMKLLLLTGVLGRSPKLSF